MTGDGAGGKAGGGAGGGAGAILHASAVEAEGAALLILGPSGSGKSSLALDLIAFGARLIADDAVRLVESGGRLLVSAPRAAEGRIEARGIGVLRLPARCVAEGATPLSLVIDLEREEPDRLPPRRVWRRGSVAAPLLLRPARLHSAALLAALRAGGPDDPDDSLSRPLADRAAGPQSFTS